MAPASKSRCAASRCVRATTSCASAAATFARAPAAWLLTPAAVIVVSRCPRNTRVPRSAVMGPSAPFTCAAIVTCSDGASDPVSSTPVVTSATVAVATSCPVSTRDAGAADVVPPASALPSGDEHASTLAAATTTHRDVAVRERRIRSAKKAMEVDMVCYGVRDVVPPAGADEPSARRTFASARWKSEIACAWLVRDCSNESRASDTSSGVDKPCS